jgi:hypothetical protein
LRFRTLPPEKKQFAFFPAAFFKSLITIRKNHGRFLKTKHQTAAVNFLAGII